LAVAAIVIWVSLQLGRKTIHDLLDAVPDGLVRQARELVQTVPGVQEVPRLRVRRTGGEWFSDVTIKVSSALTMEEAHGVADEVEKCLGELMEGGDVVVHAEPSA
jgi:divalent metal cation (Fe/Co/Zn/Cd) transporter